MEMEGQIRTSPLRPLWWLLEHSFVVVFALGYLLWAIDLRVISHAADALLGVEYAVLPEVALLALMGWAAFSRLSLWLLIALLLVFELGLAVNGHWLFFYRIATFSATGLLLILYAVRLARDDGRLKWTRPDVIDRLAQRQE
jgi:hypothetical protein